MASPTSDDSPSGASFAELNDALAAARSGLLLFAEEEGVLESLVSDAADPERRYPDIAAVRRNVTVDELLHLVASLPDTEEEDRGEEADALYPTLLEVAELFDVFIEQTSLVHGDAVALAESMESEWHGMSGCGDYDPSTGNAAASVERLEANLAGLPGLIDSVNRLSGDRKREVVGRFASGEDLPWRVEARYLAIHAVDVWFPEGVPNQVVRRAIEAARLRRRGGAEDSSAAATLARASADLVLARLVRGVARQEVSEALEEPFAGLLPAA